jgi:hypothetical protein
MRPLEAIRSRIVVVRGTRVMLDADLAALYGVTTKRLNEQVKRNRGRFPAEFVFKLTAAEKSEVVANCDHLARMRFSPALPHAFTEHGALMASAVLNTDRAVDVSLYVIRAFVQLREALQAHKEIGMRLDELERKVGGQDRSIGQILLAIRELTRPPEEPRPRRRIGFV